MTIPDGYHPIPSTKIATVVTFLEMLEPAPPRPERASSGWTLRRVERAQPAWYRELFTRVGRDYLWASRLRMPEDELAALLMHRDVEVYTLSAGGRDEGILELDFREADACELTFFGVTPALVGSGAGRWLMNRAIVRAWARPIARFWLHTCTLDHAAAPAFYRTSGFRPFRREVEVFDDPRLLGVLPRDAAPSIPLLA